MELDFSEQMGRGLPFREAVAAVGLLQVGKVRDDDVADFQEKMFFALGTMKCFALAPFPQVRQGHLPCEDDAFTAVCIGCQQFFHAPSLLYYEFSD